MHASCVCVCRTTLCIHLRSTGDGDIHVCCLVRESLPWSREVEGENGREICLCESKRERRRRR